MKFNSALSLIFLAANAVSCAQEDSLVQQGGSDVKSTGEYVTKTKVLNIWNQYSYELYGRSKVVSGCVECQAGSECSIEQRDTLDFKWEIQSEDTIDLSAVEGRLGLNTTSYAAYDESVQNPAHSALFKGPGAKKMTFAPKYLRLGFLANVTSTSDGNGQSAQNSPVEEKVITIHIPMKLENGKADGRFIVVDCAKNI